MSEVKKQCPDGLTEETMVRDSSDCLRRDAPGAMSQMQIAMPALGTRTSADYMSKGCIWMPDAVASKNREHQGHAA